MNELPPAIRVLVLVLLDLPGRAFWFIGLAYSINIAVRLSTDPAPVTPDSLWTIAYLLALSTVGILMVMFAAVLWRRRSDTSPPLQSASLSGLRLLEATSALLVAVFFLGTFFSITQSERVWSTIFGVLMLIAAFGYWFFHRTTMRLDPP